MNREQRRAAGRRGPSRQHPWLGRAQHALGGTIINGHEPSMWLRSRLADIHTRITAGTLRPCPHLQAGDVGRVALWAPDRIVCAGCSGSLRLTGTADRTCDRCASVQPTIHPHIASTDCYLAVIYGLCPDCHRRELAKSTDKETRP